MSDYRKQLIQMLRLQREELQAQLNGVSHMIAQLTLAEEKEEHPCSCVKLNRDIEIYDMQEQSRRGRVPLGLGLVADCLTALKNCQVCNGTGKPGKTPDQYESYL